MYDTLILSDVGKQALVNAQAGGVLISANRFKIGDSDASPTSKSLLDIVGSELFSGNVQFIEVLNKNTARFQIELEAADVIEDTTIYECAIFQDSAMIARAVFAEPYVLSASEPVRFNCLLVTSEADLSYIDVTVGDYSSIPSTTSLSTLGAPSTSQNAILVQQGKYNLDGTKSPVIAMRDSEGTFEWTFTDHTRAYRGRPTIASSTSFTLTGVNVDPNTTGIVHISEGSGIGKSRHFTTNAAGSYVLESPIAGLTPSSTISVWIPTFNSASLASEIPDKAGLPASWVLQVGRDSKLPTWAPSPSSASTLNRLYREPSTLKMSTVIAAGDGEKSKFGTNDIAVENINYVHPTVSAVSQHRSAFDLMANEVEFSEVIPKNLPVELRLFSREPSDGAQLEIAVDHHISDGKTKKFSMSQGVPDASHIKFFVQGIRMLPSSYIYEPYALEVELLEAPSNELPLEIRSFNPVLSEGYYTEISSYCITPISNVYLLELPFAPQSGEYIEITRSGIHVHDDRYSVQGNKVILTGPLTSGVEVEVLLYRNLLSQGSKEVDLPGMVVDGVLSATKLSLLRHGAKPVHLPIPAVNLIQGDGISITGRFPDLKVSSTVGQQLSNSKTNFVYSDTKSNENSTEVLHTQRITITDAMVISVDANFSAELGPGFKATGNERFEFVVGFKTGSSKEPAYARRVRGSGVGGFSYIPETQLVYGNASMGRKYEVEPENHPSGFIDIVIKMRVVNANIGEYNSYLSINYNIEGRAQL